MYEHLEISYIVPAYFTNPDCKDVDNLLSVYSAYNTDLLKKIHFIIIDDGSPFPVHIQTEKLNYSLLRITEDIPWNQPGARNLGVYYSKTPKLILTDVDHIFQEDTLSKVIRADIPKNIYFFKRLKNNARHHPHLNTFFCSKATYFKSLGVDEEFCGHYGFDDVYFRALQKFLNTKFRRFRSVPVLTEDHDQHNLIRDSSFNKNLLDTKLEFIKQQQPFAGHSRLFLNFHWQLVKDNFI